MDRGDDPPQNFGWGDDIAHIPPINYPHSYEKLPFRRKRPVKSVRETIQIMQEMANEVRGEYAEVEKLVRLLLVNPASSCEAERSFSALRRLKTWLRSTMTQVRLNAVAVCHIHQHLLDSVNDERIVQSFVAKSESRALIFGK